MGADHDGGGRGEGGDGAAFLNPTFTAKSPAQELLGDISLLRHLHVCRDNNPNS